MQLKNLLVQLINILKFGVLVGGIVFVFGFFGPFIFVPGANQGPLLGILGAPFGFVLGLVLGFIIAVINENYLIIILKKTYTIKNLVLLISFIVISLGYLFFYKLKKSPLVFNSSDIRWRSSALKNVSARGVTDVDIPAIKRFSQLNYLDIKSENITDIGLKYLSEIRLPYLHQLMLVRCNRITDIGIQYITEMKSLTYLSIQGSQNITDEGLGKLYPLTNLETLDIRDCPKITDRGLQSLAKMENLKKVLAGGCERIKETGIKGLPFVVTFKDY